MMTEARDEAKLSILIMSIQCHTWCSSQGNEAKKGKKIRGKQIGKEEWKLALFSEGMIIIVENLKDFTKKESQGIYKEVTGGNRV